MAHSTVTPAAALLSDTKDEEIVAIAETCSSTVDALQVLLGCTAGNGNLFVNSWGKTAFSFYRRDTNTSIRLVVVPDAVPKNPRMIEFRPKIREGSAMPAEDEELHRLSQEHVDAILAAPAEKLFVITAAVQPLPQEAKSIPTLSVPSAANR